MIAGTPDEVLRYWQRKAEHLAAKLDAARRRIERLTAQLADERRYARDLTAQRDGAAETATRLAAELAELRALAETAMRAPSITSVTVNGRSDPPGASSPSSSVTTGELPGPCCS